MASRKPSDVCLLCQGDGAYATKTNSHIVPAALLKSLIGKRGKEYSFQFDPGKAETDEYYGRDRLDNPTTEIKEHHHARDFYFCPECEDKLAALEGRATPHLAEKLRDAKFDGNYRRHSSDDLVWKELLKVNPDDFNVLFLSTIWRKALQEQIDNGVTILPENDLETIRNLVHSYVSGDLETYKELCGKYPMMILTAEAFTDATGNLVAVPNWLKKPYAFFVNEFIVLLYTEADLIVGMKKPEAFFEFPPDSRFLNVPGKTPTIIILPQNFWDNLTKRWLTDNANAYADRLVQKIKKTKRMLQQPPKSRKQKQKIRQAIRSRRALKSKRRKRNR